MSLPTSGRSDQGKREPGTNVVLGAILTNYGPEYQYTRSEVTPVINIEKYLYLLFTFNYSLTPYISYTVLDPISGIPNSGMT
jgi:hypothetical protein